MQDSNNMFVFFKPSTELAREIISQNQALVKEYTAKTLPQDSAETNGDESIFGRFGLGYPRATKPALKSPDETGQELIAERLYHYLTSLAESPWSIEGGSFPVSEYLPNGMITMLGFSSLRRQPKSVRALDVWQLVERLTEEFLNWLANEQNGAFVTPWLEMHLTAEGELRLIAIPETELEDSSSQENEPRAAAAAKIAGAYGIPRPSVEDPIRAFHVTETARREISAVAKAIEAGKKAYREERMRNELRAEDLSVTTEEEHGQKETRQDRSFAAASARTEEKGG